MKRGCIILVSGEIGQEIHVGRIQVIGTTLVEFKEHFFSDSYHVKLQGDSLPEVKEGADYPLADVDADGFVVVDGTRTDVHFIHASPPLPGTSRWDGKLTPDP